MSATDVVSTVVAAVPGARGKARSASSLSCSPRPSSSRVPKQVKKARKEDVNALAKEHRWLTFIGEHEKRGQHRSPPSGGALLRAFRDLADKQAITSHPGIRRAAQLKVEERGTGKTKSSRSFLLRLPGPGGTKGGSVLLYSSKWDSAYDTGNLQVNASPTVTRALRACLLRSGKGFCVPLLHQEPSGFGTDSGMQSP